MEKLINFKEKQVQKAETKSKVDKMLRLAVLANVITVPFWIAIGHPELALFDIWGGVATEEARKGINKIRGRNKISSSRLALAS